MARNGALYRRHEEDSNVLPLHQRPIDMEHLSRQALGDDALALEILRLFADTLAAYHERLDAAVTRDDLLMQLHTIKGASMGVGAWALADLARLAESELRAGEPVNPERIDDIGMAVHEVTAFIAVLCGDESPV